VVAPGHRRSNSRSGSNFGEPAMKLPTIGETVLTNYAIEDIMNIGGQAIACEGRDLLTGERVVIRQLALSPKDKYYPEAAHRFEQTGRIRVSHSNLVETIATGREGDRLLQVQRFVEGQELAAILATQGRLPVKDAISVCGQIAAGLGALHDQGIVHRDVKPANIIVNAQHHTTVIDLGICKVPGGATQAWCFLGSLGYSAPEQLADAANCDTRADVFALGCVLYECLTGRCPFSATSVDEYRTQVLTLPAAAHVLEPTVPLHLSHLCSDSLAAQPDRRPPTTSEFSQRLNPSVITVRCLACGGRQRSLGASCPHCARLFTGAKLTMLSGPDRDQQFCIPLGTYEVGRNQLAPTDRAVSRSLWRVEASRITLRLVPIDLPTLARFMSDGDVVTIGSSIAWFSWSSHRAWSTGIPNI
jgi:serine/threonine protein kinase